MDTARTTHPTRLVIALGLALLVGGLDLLRAYAGPALRPAQWAMGACVVFVLWRELRAGGRPLGERWPYLLLAACLVPTWVDHTRLLAPGDSVHYYSFLRSVLFDRDLDLRNDYALLGWDRPDLPNVLPVGAPVLWAPVIALLHVGRLAAARGWGLPAADGSEPLYQAGISLATLIYGTAALFLLLHTLRRWVAPGPAFWATVLCWVGSPLRFYLAVLPALAHGVEFFAAVLVLRATLALRDACTARHAVQAGAACGLAFLTRSQDGLLLLVPAAVLLAAARDRVSAGRLLRPAGAMAAGFLLVAWPQLLVWQLMFHRAVLVPHTAIHGSSFLQLAQPALLSALVSDRGGLFATYPLMLLAAGGLVLLARREGAIAAGVALAGVATWYLNAAVFDWYQVRRFTGLVPLLAPGLALVLAPLTRRAAVGAALALLALRYDLAIDALRSVPGASAPIKRVGREMADGAVADVFAFFEPFAPSAGVRLLSIYTGDRIGERDVRFDLGAEPWIVRLPRRARHLSPPGLLDGEGARWVRDSDEARFFVPVATPRDLAITVRIHGRGETPAPVDILWRETTVASGTAAEGWTDVPAIVPAAAMRVGANDLVVRFGNPRTRRAGAIASIVLAPR
jgi:hypothetical protein